MQTYEEIRGHKADFVVSYRLYSPDEGGRKVTFQHLRCDFMYYGDNPSKDGVYMIHPEFFDENEVPLDEEFAVPLSGRASMWILVPEMREIIHKSKVNIGVKGYFMEGSRKIGEVAIEKILGLHENPCPPS